MPLDRPLTRDVASLALGIALAMASAGAHAAKATECTKLGICYCVNDELKPVIAAGRDPATTPLAAVMTMQPQTIHPDEPFLNAMRIMHRGGFRHLPVAEHGRPLGMVSARDALDDDLYELSVNLEQQENMLE